MSQTNDCFVASEFTYPEYTSSQRDTLKEAIGILEAKLKKSIPFTDAKATQKYCQLKLAGEKDEFFACLFLDNQHKLISFEKLFRGSIAEAHVHPRVVVRRSLELNAASIIFTHNHPSGTVTPSKPDIAITQRLKDVLKVVDVRVLDHIIVGTEGSTSMAESGLV